MLAAAAWASTAAIAATWGEEAAVGVVKGVRWLGLGVEQKVTGGCWEAAGVSGGSSDDCKLLDDTISKGQQKSNDHHG